MSLNKAFGSHNKKESILSVRFVVNQKQGLLRPGVYFAMESCYLTTLV